MALGGRARGPERKAGVLSARSPCLAQGTRGGRRGARKGSNLSSGRSCSTSDSEASSSSTFSTSRGTRAPAAPHTVKGFREDSARLWVRPQTPGPARTLKLSSRRHRLPARPPTAPLLSGLLGAHAQCSRPRDSAHSGHARACGPVGKGAGASAHEARSSSAAPPPPPHPRRLREDSSQTAICLHATPPPGTRGLHPLGCARRVNSAGLPRHGIGRMPADASASSAQSSGITTTQSAP